MGISSTKHQDRPKEITFLSQAFAGKAGLEEQSHIYFLTRKLPQDAKGSSFSKAEPFVSVCVQVRANAKPASRPQGTSNSFLIYVPNSLQTLKWTEGRVQRKYLAQSRQLDGYSEFSSEEQGAFTPEWSRHSTWLRKGLWKMQTCCLCDPINKCTENWITWEKKSWSPIWAGAQFAGTNCEGPGGIFLTGAIWLCWLPENPLTLSLPTQNQFCGSFSKSGLSPWGKLQGGRAWARPWKILPNYGKR